MCKSAIIAITSLCLLFTVNSLFAATPSDPLRPPNYSKSSVLPMNKDKKWYVNEILSSEGRRIAIVNNKMVSIGDKVDGAKVIDITPDQVKLKYENRIIYSPLTLIEVKKLSKPGVGH